MTNLRRSLDVVDVDTANRAEVLDDLAKSLESVKVSVTLILGHAISALECRVPPDALVSKTLATRGPGAGILELSLFDHNLGHESMDHAASQSTSKREPYWHVHLRISRPSHSRERNPVLVTHKAYTA